MIVGVEIEGTHVYSGEEWTAMPPEIQQYALDRLDACGRLHAKLLHIRIKDNYTHRIVIDEIGRKVRLIIVHTAIDFVADFRHLLGVDES